MGWMTDAECARPSIREIWDYMGENGQIRVCSRCPVVDECRAYSDRLESYRRSQDLTGVFAGETVQDRLSRRRREWRKRAKRDGREVMA